MAGYDIGRLTPGGAVTRHVEGTLETDEVWLFVREGDDPRGRVLYCWPSHAVYAVEVCGGPDGTESCAATHLPARTGV